MLLFHLALIRLKFTAKLESEIVETKWWTIIGAIPACSSPIFIQIIMSESIYPTDK
jgi:hypothetical protein